jgi:hypothetical protein
LTVAVRQGSFTDRSPTRVSAVNVEASGLVAAQHLQRRAAALQILRAMHTWRVLACPVRELKGLGAVRKAAAPPPFHWSPALVTRGHGRRPLTASELPGF